MSNPTSRESRQVQSEQPEAYLIDIERYCDHAEEKNVLVRQIPKGIPERYIKNIRPLYALKEEE